MHRRTALSLSLENFGTSVDGAPLQWLPPRSGQLDFLLIAGIHGEEPDTTVILSRALRSVLPADIDRNVGVVLCVNPDGLALGTRGNSRGVDLNRNFASRNWQPDSVTCRWHVGDPEGIPIGTGSGPASEPETQALQRLILEQHPRQILSLHGPLDCIDDPEETPLARWLAAASGSPQVREIGYPTPGSMGSWTAEGAFSLVTWEFPMEGIEALSRRFVPILRDCLRLPLDQLVANNKNRGMDSV